MSAPNTRTKRNDQDRGIDLRGDLALFLADSHFTNGGATLDIDVGELTFFRVLDANGEQTGSHGWAEGTNVVQWG